MRYLPALVDIARQTVASEAARRPLGAHERHPTHGVSRRERRWMPDDIALHNLGSRVTAQQKPLAKT
jgi:hypothetical protein